MRVKLLLVDGFNLIRRIYEGIPVEEPPLDEVVANSLRSLERALEYHEPTHVCCAFEYHDPTWRHLLYPEYKEGRKPTPPGLLGGLGRFIETFAGIGVKSIAVESYEADDVIATLARGVADGGGDAVILATDKMYLQLLDEHIRVFDHFAGKYVTASEVRERYSVEPRQLVDYWAMTGDATNNIKGVSGVGPKSAATLLGEFGSLDAILHAETDSKLAARVRGQEPAAIKARHLVTLKQDVEVGVNLKELRYYHGK